MGKLKVTDFFLYRWRYPLGYAVFCVVAAALLVIAGLFVIGGLSQPEINSALISEALNPSKMFALQPEQLLFLPYRLLQAVSIAVIGFTPFGIKLPSMLLGLLSAFGLVLLLQLWFRRNVAIIAATIGATSSQFLLISQSGHAGVSYIFLAIALLLLASLITRQGKLAPFWTILAFMVAGISLYMPLNVYILAALAATCAFHPHARHILFKKTSKPALAIGTLLFGAIVAPLAVGIFHQPQLGLTMLGVVLDPAQLLSNLSLLATNYGSFYTPSSGIQIVPVFSLGTVLLILLGTYQLFTAKYTTQSYIISFWLLLLVPFIIMNPEYVSITFVPAVLLIANAIQYLIRSWYRLFPRNPYARIFGLLPLAVVLIGTVTTSIDRFAYGYHYAPDRYSVYNYDISMLNKLVKEEPKEQSEIVIVASAKNKDLYSAFARQNSASERLSVTTTAPERLNEGTTLIVARDASVNAAQIPTKIATTNAAENADRFYVYK